MLTVLRLMAFFVGAVVIVAFAVANRGDVVIEFFPLPIAAIQIPVYAIFQAGMVIGALLGAVIVWLSSLPVRRELRRIRRQLQRTENQIKQDRLREEEAAAERSRRRSKERTDDADDTAVPLTGPGISD